MKFDVKTSCLAEAWDRFELSATNNALFIIHDVVVDVNASFKFLTLLGTSDMRGALVAIRKPAPLKEKHGGE